MSRDAWKQVGKAHGEIYCTILLTSAHYPEISGEWN